MSLSLLCVYVCMCVFVCLRAYVYPLPSCEALQLSDSVTCMCVSCFCLNFPECSHANVIQPVVLSLSSVTHIRLLHSLPSALLVSLPPPFLPPPVTGVECRPDRADPGGGRHGRLHHLWTVAWLHQDLQVCDTHTHTCTQTLTHTYAIRTHILSHSHVNTYSHTQKPVNQGSQPLGTRASTGTGQHNHWHTYKKIKMIYFIYFFIIIIKKIHSTMRQHNHCYRFFFALYSVLGISSQCKYV